MATESCLPTVTTMKNNRISSAFLQSFNIVYFFTFLFR